MRLSATWLSAFQRVGAQVSHPTFDFPFVLWFAGPAWHNLDPVMPAEVGQFRINFWIKPIGLKNRCF